MAETGGNASVTRYRITLENVSHQVSVGAFRAKPEEGGGEGFGVFLEIQFGKDAVETVDGDVVSADELPQCQLLKRFPGQATRDYAGKTVLFEKEQVFGENMTH
jgi:hypothetical protein